MREWLLITLTRSLDMIEKPDSLSALERRFMDKFHLFVEPVRVASSQQQPPRSSLLQHPTPISTIHDCDDENRAAVDRISSTFAPPGMLQGRCSVMP